MLPFSHSFKVWCCFMWLGPCEGDLEAGHMGFIVAEIKTSLVTHMRTLALSCQMKLLVASDCISSTCLKCILFRRIRERRYTLWSGTFYMLYFAEHIYKHIHTFINVLEQWKSYTLMHERGKFPIQVLPDFSLPLTHVAAFCLCQRDTVFLAKPKWTLVSWCLSTMYIFCWGHTYTYSTWI